MKLTENGFTIQLYVVLEKRHSTARMTPWSDIKHISGIPFRFGARKWPLDPS
jgi:hypothetical protein